jgi:type II secretory pathway pseudopilin PulG
MKANLRTLKKQAGLTLMEIIGGLVILGLVIAGALSQWGSASAAQTSQQMMKDVIALRAGTQSMFAGQTNYGTASLNGALISANKVPSTMTASGTSITAANGGVVTVTGNTTNTITRVEVSKNSQDVCSAMLTSSGSGWSKIRVGSGTVASPTWQASGNDITTFPVTPAIATGTTACTLAAGLTNGFVLEYTSVN